MKPIEELTFTDDYMFGYVMRNEEICKGLLERLLGIKIQRLEFPTLQKTIAPHYESKGVRLDVYVQDSSRVFDIEIQNSLHDDLPTRTRYYQSMMDIDLLLKGKQYSELKESNLPESSLYLSDAFWSKKINSETTPPGVLGAGSPQAVLGKDGGLGEGKPRFRVEGCPSPKDLTLELKVKVCKIKGEEPSQIVQNCPDLEQYVQFLKLIDKAKSDGQAQPLTRAIREAVRHNILRDYLERKGGETLSILMTEYDYATDIAVKQEEAYAEGVSFGLLTGREEGISIGLERGIERGLEQGRLEGLERGAYETKLETAKKLIAMGLSFEQAAEGTGLAIETIQQFVDTM